jgi:hypothetical protein
MSLNLNLNGIDTKTTDKVGKQSYFLPTDVYDAEILLAYLISSSSSKSKGLFLVLKINNEEKSFQTYYTNKNDELFYIDKKDNTKKALPGLLLLSALTQITLNKTFDSLGPSDFSKKTIKVWNNDAKTELPKEVDVITSLTGKKVKVALEQIEQNKYSDVTRTEMKNQIVKFFNDKGYTSTELENLQKDPTTQPEFITKWLEVNKDKIVDKVDRSKIKATASVGSKPVTELNLDDEEL